MIALFVSAAVVGVMLIIVMQKGSFSADNLPPPTSVDRVQIDDGNYGRDTFGNHLNLCRNDKMNDCCCISGT